MLIESKETGITTFNIENIDLQCSVINIVDGILQI